MSEFLSSKIGLLVVGAALGLLTALILRRRDQNVASDSAVIKRLDEIDRQMAILMTQVSPLWAAVQSKIAKDLTHPSPQFHEMDELLRKLEALDITAAERKRLQELLDERILSKDPEVSDDEKASAKLMKGVMAKVVNDANTEGEITSVKLVGEKTPEKETR